MSKTTDAMVQGAEFAESVADLIESGELDTAKAHQALSAVWTVGALAQLLGDDDAAARIKAANDRIHAVLFPTEPESAA